MQLITLTSGLAAAFLATAVSADSDWNKNSTGNVSNRAKVINNCPYKVYLWSILKGQGCPGEHGVQLNTGDFYHEAFRSDGSDTGVSIKISKTSECKGGDITQLEYFENHKTGFEFNFLDVSYVDCLGGDCPGRKDGYYLKSGNPNTATIADASNPICPTFSCTDAASCDKTSYVGAYDIQTKSCGLGEPLDFYLCGQSAQEPQEPEEEKPSPSSSQPKPSSVEKETPTPTTLAVKIAEVTPPAVVSESKPANVKTEVVYVTKYETVNAKRHAHGHAHKHFRA